VLWWQQSGVVKKKAVRRDAGRLSALAIAHRGDVRLVPMKVRPDVGASLAAGLAHEAWLKIGKPDVIRPFIRVDRDRVAAMEIRAINQDTAHA
jgi:hypothetical protein